MKLADLAASNLQLTQTTLASDTELVRDIQKHLGIKEDGIWGWQTDNAIASFCQSSSLNNATTMVFGKTFARLLLEYKIPIVLITLAQATAIFGRSPTPEQMEDLNRCLVRFEITSPENICMFLANLAHESGGLKWLKELSDGHYMEGRKDLGNCRKGDGAKFKGSGALQLSGRNNYTAFSKFMNDPKIIEIGCDYVASTYAFCSAGFWWWQNGISKKIRNGASFQAVSSLVNGKNPPNGWADRQRYYAIAKKCIST